MAISILFNPMPQRIFEADGDFASGAKAYFYLARTTTPLTVYTDAPLEVPHTWPVVADAYGLLAPIYIGKGTEYKVRIEDENGNLLYAADGIDNPAEPTGGEGGGGGLVITADQVAKTGDFDWQPTTADRAGWIRSNGKSIGSALASTADSRNDLYENLFIFLWNAFPNELCPVSAGRGTNAMLDWDAAKSIGTLDMRGYGNAGLDDMGTTKANRIQVSTSFGCTLGATTCSVSSSVGLCAGMYIQHPAVAPGTRVVSIVSPTAITISAPSILLDAGSPGRFSIFQDAIAPGSGGGENTHIQSLLEVYPHAHAITDPGHGHHTSIASTDIIMGRDLSTGIYAISGGAVGSGLFNQAGLDANTTGIAGTQNAGGGMPMNIWTPTRLGTWFVKV